ncbi:MAG: glycosyltransferase family 4 protein [Kiritimatiellae bacterium]|nr:glycosyltransferase family 4 protein [Kiritimatiellia bacterium]
MHIVQILPALDEGGVERGTVELNAALVAHGFRSTVISSGGRLVDAVERAGGRHISLPVKSKNPLTAFSRMRRLRRVLMDLAPDVVHFRSRVPGWLTVWANRTLHLPLVSTVHGFNSVSPYSRVMTMGDRVICPSTSVVAFIKQHYGTPEEKIRLVYRGINPDAFDPERLDRAWMAAFVDRFGLRDRFIVLGVGRITQLKGYDVLIRATAKAAERLPAIKTVIVGGAESARQAYAESLEALVRELHLEDRVVFAGSQSRMAEIYALGNVLVSGNQAKPEAFGRSMAEALAMGCPVIATRFGGALDIVREGIDGWLIPPGDVDALADHLVQAASTRWFGLRQGAMARFALERMVEGTLAVYQELRGL